MQRVAIGRALVRRPKALLMDEPIGALDAKLREDMRAELKRLHIENGTTSVYVTHDQVEAMSLADRVAVMNDGVLQQVGTPSEVYLHPANLFVAQFVGRPVMNIMPARGPRRGGGTAVSIGGGHGVRLPGRARRRGWRRRCRPGTTLVVGVRPEAVKVAREAGEGLRPVEAQFIEPLGAYDIVDLKVGERFLKARTAERLRRAPGDAVWARLDAAQVHFFDATTGDVLDIRLGAWLRSGSTTSARASAGTRRSTALTLDGRRRRVLRAARADRRREDHDAAADRRARAAGRAARSASAARTPPAGAWRSATWRWSSSTTRSIRATRCGRTWRSR